MRLRQMARSPPSATWTSETSGASARPPTPAMTATDQSGAAPNQRGRRTPRGPPSPRARRGDRAGGRPKTASGPSPPRGNAGESSGPGTLVMGPPGAKEEAPRTRAEGGQPQRSKPTLSISSLALARRLAISDTGMGSGFSAPNEATSGLTGTPGRTGYS